MPVTAGDRSVVEGLFRAMQKGPAGEDEMMALFQDDAVFVEPFSGAVQTHSGKASIRESFRSMWRAPAPDLKLNLDRVDTEGDKVRAEWTCTSPVFPAPMRGHDLFTIKSGKIARLEIVVTEMPPMGPPQ
jgi:hypothetical protein